MESVNDYYSAIQLRSDRWSALREATEALTLGGSERQMLKLRERVQALLDSLSVIEPYWAFPGMAAFEHMRRQFEHGSYDDLSYTTHRILRALTTGAYRRRHIPLDRQPVDCRERLVLGGRLGCDDRQQKRVRFNLHPGSQVA